MKKTAIITGASRGIGYAAAKKLGMDGCQVVLFATGEKERYKAAINGSEATSPPVEVRLFKIWQLISSTPSAGHPLLYSSKRRNQPLPKNLLWYRYMNHLPLPKRNAANVTR